jgi:hypothetical protein
MDRKLRNLQRLSATDPVAKERYIRELERLAGLGYPSDETTLECLVTGCSNRADQGYGTYLITQPSIPGKQLYNWDAALGPLFICLPCFNHLKKWKDEIYSSKY